MAVQATEPVKLTLEQLEAMVSEVPIERNQRGGIILSAACHNGAPVYPIYIQGTGTLALRCTYCGQVFATVPVARGTIVLPRGNGMGGV